MVVEQIVSIGWLKKDLFSLVLGLLYTILAAITSYIFFRDNISISLLFLITLLLVPSLATLLSAQEKVERKQGLKHFFRNHKDVFEVYLFLSIGVVIGYLLIIWIFGILGMDINVMLSEQVKAFGTALTSEGINNFTGQGLGHALGIFTSNLGVAIIFFILAFFYGAGSIFLIVWNASIFSAFIVLSIQNISKGLNHVFGLLGAFSIYFIPEFGGFLLAGIAGGVISKAIINEHFMNDNFRNVVRDATVLLLLSFLLLIVAALLESLVVVNLIKALV